MKIRDRVDEGHRRLLAALARAPLVPEHTIHVAVACGLGLRSDTARPLMESELAVLRCLSRGLTIAMTADALGRHPDTVRAQLRAARYKLRAKNQAHAVAEALRRGLIL